jgi:PPM family protein phosphatase
MTDPTTRPVNRPLPIRVSLFGKTDVGQIREHNEDNFVAADLSQGRRLEFVDNREFDIPSGGLLLGVCDGMGGAAAGEVASQLAVDLLFNWLSQANAREPEDLAHHLVQAVEGAGRKIYQEARSDRTRRGMGTTSTVGALLSERLYLGQVGDSRAYILRNEVLTQVTRDQSLVNQLIEAGQLTVEEAETFEHNNIILQALGTAETVQVDLTIVDLRAGDTLLLCSDGLSGMVKDAELRNILAAASDPKTACERLIDRANAAGGHDNITVVVATFTGPGLRQAGPDDLVKYTKHALQPRVEEAPPVTAPLEQPQTVEPTPLSTEAANESRPLRVGHTLFGTNDEIEKARAAARARMHSAPPKPRSSSFPPAGQSPSYRPSQANVAATGVAPRWVGAVVVLALLLIAGMGIALLR